MCLYPSNLDRKARLLCFQFPEPAHPSAPNYCIVALICAFMAAYSAAMLPFLDESSQAIFAEGLARKMSHPKRCVPLAAPAVEPLTIWCRS